MANKLILLMDCVEEKHEIDISEPPKKGFRRKKQIEKVTAFRPLLCFHHGDITDKAAFRANFICDQFFDTKDNAYKYMVEVLAVLTKTPEAMTKDYEMLKHQEKIDESTPKPS